MNQKAVCLKILLVALFVDQLLFGGIHAMLQNQIRFFDQAFVIFRRQQLFDIFTHQRVDTEKVVEILVGEDDIVLLILDECACRQVFHEEFELLFGIFEGDLRIFDLGDVSEKSDDAQRVAMRVFVYLTLDRDPACLLPHEDTVFAVEGVAFGVDMVFEFLDHLDLILGMDAIEPGLDAVLDRCAQDTEDLFETV